MKRSWNVDVSHFHMLYYFTPNSTPTNLNYNKFHSIMLYNHIWKQKSHGNLWGRGLLANKARTKLYATYLLLQPPLRLPLLLTSHATSNRMRTQDEIFALKETKKISFYWRNVWLNYRLQYILSGYVPKILLPMLSFSAKLSFIGLK